MNPPCMSCGQARELPPPEGCLDHKSHYDQTANEALRAFLLGSIAGGIPKSTVQYKELELERNEEGNPERIIVHLYSGRKYSVEVNLVG